MSRVLLPFIFFQLIGCSPSSQSQLRFQNIIWVNKDLKFDTVYAPDRSVYSIYGSGTLLFFSSNQTVKSFSNMFINSNDSIAWGEPGVTIKKGNWKLFGFKVVAKTSTTEQTFSPLPAPSDKAIIDSYELQGDTLIQNGKTRFIPAKLLTRELDLVMRGSKGQTTTTTN